jgi:hypothetical protein
MTTKNTGVPASPHGDPTHGGENGMTLRDYFAAKALSGMLCNGYIPEAFRPEGSVLQEYRYIEIAYAIADAMIEARK